MKTLKREMYHFDGKDYERFDSVELIFFVQRVSIQNFINIVKNQINAWIYKIDSKFIADFHPTHVDSNLKEITVRASAFAMYEIVKKLGKTDYSEIQNRWFIRNASLRAYDFYTAKNRYKKSLFNGKIKYRFDYTGKIIFKSIKGHIVLNIPVCSFRSPLINLNS
jgi:hypothetical protein